MSELHPQQAMAIVRAEAAVDRAAAALKAAKKERDAVRARYREAVPLDEEIEVAGYSFKRVQKTTGPSFRLKAYLERHQLTDEMRPFVGTATSYEDWHVKPVAGGELLVPATAA